MRRLLTLLLAVGACRSAPRAEVEAPAQPTDWPAAPGIKPAPCTGADDCYAKGRELVAREDPEGRERLFQACALGSNKACADHGIACASGRAGPVDDTRARESLGPACARTRDADACAWLSLVLARSPNTYGDREDAAKHGCSTKEVAPENRDARAQACVLARRTNDACALGHRPSCDKTLNDLDPRTLNEGVLTVRTIKHEGVLFLSDVRCEVPGGQTYAGLLGGIDAVGGLKPLRKELEACGKRTRATRISWTSERDRMTDVAAEASNDGERRCILRALKGAPAPIPSKCSATIHYGRP